MASASDDLPIIPHEDIADVDCCGCLIVRVRGGEADILCNECAAVIRRVPVGDVEAAMLERRRTQFVASRIVEPLPPFRDSRPSRHLYAPSVARGS